MFYFEKKKHVAGLVECWLLKLKITLVAGNYTAAGSATLETEDLEECLRQISPGTGLTAQAQVLQKIASDLKAVDCSGVAEKIACVQSQADAFELTAAALFRYRSRKLLAMLKELSAALSRETRNYYFYEYYYLYYHLFHTSADSSDETHDEMLFNDVYYFFHSNRRIPSHRLNAVKLALDERASAYEKFRTVQLRDDSYHWQLPEDFFYSLLAALEKEPEPDLVRLVIHESDAPMTDDEKQTGLFDFLSEECGKFPELTMELVQEAVSSLKHLDLDINGVKEICQSEEKAFYIYGNTKGVLWKISQELFGVLVLAFRGTGLSGYNFPERQAELLQKFAVLIQRYYSNDYKMNRSLGFIISCSPAIKQMKQMILKVGNVPYPVLIRGESGSGKELVAKAVHLSSSRSGKPFVPVNAAAIPENLLEAELFGYKKGAFTGAAETKMGLFQAAHNGTLFLDEIGDLPLNLQAKLLRVLQENEIRRLGETKTIKVDFRLITATNKDLQQMIGDGRFREDLYYRINDLLIYIPPLRERMEDIPLLLNHFMEKYNFTPETKDDRNRILVYFSGLDYPGNIRQLESRVKRMITFYPQLDIENLPDTLHSGKHGLTAARERLERSLVTSALKECGGNRQEAADLLKIGRTSLFNLMKKYQLE